MRTNKKVSKFDIINDFGDMYTMEDLVNIYLPLHRKGWGVFKHPSLNKLPHKPIFPSRDLYNKTSKYNKS